MLPPRPAHGPCHLVLRCLGWCSGDPIPASWDQSSPPPPAPEGPACRDGRRLWLYFPGLACCGPGLGPPTGPVPHLPEETLGGWSWQPLGSYGSSPVPVLVPSRGRMDAGTRRVPPRPQSRWREPEGQRPPRVLLPFPWGTRGRTGLLGTVAADTAEQAQLRLAGINPALGAGVGARRGEGTCPRPHSRPRSTDGAGPRAGDRAPERAR